MLARVELVVTLDSELLLESLVEAAAAGDEQAWQRLWAAVEPRLIQIIAQPRFLGRLGQREDDRRNVVVDVLARLRADNFHRLRIYLDTRTTNPALKFMTWLRVDQAGRHRLPARPSRLHRSPSRPRSWKRARRMGRGRHVAVG